MKRKRKYTVCLYRTRTIYESAEVDVKADSPEEAEALALKESEEFKPGDWNVDDEEWEDTETEVGETR